MARQRRTHPCPACASREYDHGGCSVCADTGRVSQSVSTAWYHRHKSLPELAYDLYELVNRIPPLAMEIMREVRDPVVLFLGCMLHDAGKGRGGSHSKKGAELVPVRRPFRTRHFVGSSAFRPRRDLPSNSEVPFAVA